MAGGTYAIDIDTQYQGCERGTYFGGKEIEQLGSTPLHDNRTIFPMPGCGYWRLDHRIVTEKIGCGEIERLTNLFEIFNSR